MIARLQTIPDRVLALALLGISVVVIAMLVVGPAVMGHAAYRSGAAKSAAELLRFESLAKQAPAIEQNLADIDSYRETSNDFLRARSPELGLAALQQLIDEIAQTEGVSIKSVQTLEVEPGETLETVALRAQFNATFEQFHNILYAVETHQPLIFVDELDIRSAGASMSASDVAAKRSSRFTILLTISAFTLVE